MHGTRWMLAVLVGVMAVATMGGAGVTAQEQGRERCCFTNPRYAGVCSVIPDPGVSCADVLEYLNSPNSTGKDYCDSTPLRGGWEQVDCAAPPSDAGTGTRSGAPGR